MFCVQRSSIFDQNHSFNFQSIKLRARACIFLMFTFWIFEKTKIVETAKVWNPKFLITVSDFPKLKKCKITLSNFLNSSAQEFEKILYDKGFWMEPNIYFLFPESEVTYFQGIGHKKNIFIIKIEFWKHLFFWIFRFAQSPRRKDSVAPKFWFWLVRARERFWALIDEFASWQFPVSRWNCDFGVGIHVSVRSGHVFTIFACGSKI